MMDVEDYGNLVCVWHPGSAMFSVHFLSIGDTLVAYPCCVSCVELGVFPPSGGPPSVHLDNSYEE